MLVRLNFPGLLSPPSGLATVVIWPKKVSPCRAKWVSCQTLSSDFNSYCTQQTWQWKSSDWHDVLKRKGRSLKKDRILEREKDKWLSSLTAMRCITPSLLKCWFDPIQVRLNTIKEFVNMMAFMFCSYLATTMEDI